ncbi:FHA domain-containing protein [Leifsonia shinshuensis]|uniref:FHA domain-containing protein n=1 Tax=Leifsonia shinshuensis TaxID=150026 RepID=A0A7G6Y7R7_9MICO|nr:FHA domain-containing protein [Leifsonia shinshuensis]QNE34532.1 FHA domain-containing protein [Leifsonia shinshuensis]
MFEVQQATAGEWAVVAAAGRALLVAQAGREPLLRYLTAVRTGFAETLDALIADGLSRTPAFGLLDTSGEAVLLAVRGLPATVTDDGGPRELRAAVSSWLETQVEAASAVTLGEPGGATLPVAEGIVRGTALVWTASGDAAAPPRDGGEPAKLSRITEPVVLEDGALEPVALEPGTLEPVAPEPAPVDQPTRVPESTIAEPPEREPSGYDHLFGATMMRGIEEAAVRAEQAQEPARIDLPGFITDSFPSAAAVGDHDGLTVLSGDLPARTPVEAAAEPPAEPAEPPAAAGYRLILPDGRSEPLAGAVIVGRAPSASAFRTLRGARPLTLTGVEEDISRSHVAVAVEGDTVVVTDLHSRNGTLIVLPGKSPQKLRAGEPTTVVAGTVVDLGSGATLTVEAGR